MRNILCFLVCIIFAIEINAQTNPPSIQWQKCLGGSGEDSATAIIQTRDNGFIVAGFSNSNDGDVTNSHYPSIDYWIVKLDSLGNIQWQRSFGGNSSDYATSIQQTTDGGYIVAGYSNSTNGDVTNHHGTTDNYDYWVIKLDTSGHIQWQKSYGGSHDEKAYSIQQTKDSGYIVAGYTYSDDGDVSGNHDSTGSFSDYWVVKLDTAGNIKWQRCYGGSYNDYAMSIQQTVDGGYIIAGSTSSDNGDVSGNHNTGGVYPDYWVVKVDTGGNIQWQKCLGGHYNDEAYSIQQVNDSGYIVAGRSDSPDGNNINHAGHYDDDYWVVKLDTAGNIKWENDYGGSLIDEAFSIRQTNDNGYIIAGETWSYAGDVTGHFTSNNYTNEPDYWVVKIDTGGNLLWEECLGGDSLDIATSVLQTRDGGYIVAGSSMSTNCDVTGNHGGWDYWIVKLSYFMGIKRPSYISEISVFPNPTKGTIDVRLVPNTKYVLVCNDIGQIIEKKLVENENSISLNINSPGLYYLQVITDDQSITKKVIVIH